MIIKRFALGVRFDTLKDRFEASDIDLIVSELSKVLTRKYTEELNIFGGLCKLSPDDSEGVYTLVFTNGGLTKMRGIYSRIYNDAKLHAMLEARVPFIQNNIVRRFQELEFFGIVGSDGCCTGGTRNTLVFPKKAQVRPHYSEKSCVLVAPNSFKGTISADTAAKHIMRAMRNEMPEITCIPVPIADGGDGTLDAIEKALLVQRRNMEVTAPYSNKVTAEYLVIDGTKAIIESALASGLALCSGQAPDVLHASSRGTGELIVRAAHEGVRQVFVCLGGSATNDCGIGLAQALGVRFFDGEGDQVTYAADMGRIVRMDASEMDEQVKSIELIAVCDVSNPLTGKHGATYTYGPQKGAGAEELAILEDGMKNMEMLLNGHSGRQIGSEPGSGAAGGMGAMLKALGASSMPGSDAILDIADFDSKLKNAALVITGEGRIDSTSLEGKAVGAVISRSHKAVVPAALIAGSRGEGAEKVEALTNFFEYSGSETNALEHFDDAASRLAKDISKILR